MFDHFVGLVLTVLTMYLGMIFGESQSDACVFLSYVCSTLIEMGAETSCRDDVNWTPLDYAARNGFSKTVSVLLDNDAPVDACDKNKTSPLHHASSNGHVDCINLLLDHGARIDLETIARQNCLDLAVENNQKEACMALLKHKRYRPYRLCITIN